MLDNNGKICKGCFEYKLLESFSLNPSKINPLRLRSRCKTCDKRHRDLEQSKVKVRVARDIQKIKDPLFYEKRRKWEERYRQTDKCRKVKRKRRLYRYQQDINFRIRVILRSRLNLALRTKAKRGSAVKDLGCSISEFISYLEKQFSADMSWGNYGSLWEIDHIIPLKNFDLTVEEEVKRACHFSNLRPLGISENRGRN